MALRKYLPTVSESNEDPYLISISDLMAGLLSIFIIAFTYYILTFHQATAQLSENLTKRTEILQTLQRELREKNIETIIDTEHGVLRLPEGVLFDVGQARLKESGHTTVQVLGPILYHVLNRPEFVGTVDTVFIEGHTDNLPIQNVQFSSNWELSSQRAINTFHALTESAVGLTKLTNSKQEMLLSCSGYADTRPIQSNLTEQGRRDNRRIDLRFSMTPPTKEDANRLRSQHR